MPARLFLVEDEEILATTLRQVLEHLGYAVVGQAESGEAALAAMAEFRPDLVLMDINLTGPLDGIATAIRLREEWAVPVIFLSGYAGEPNRARAKQARPVGYLVKPSRNASSTLPSRWPCCGWNTSGSCSAPIFGSRNRCASAQRNSPRKTNSWRTSSPTPPT